MTEPRRLSPHFLEREFACRCCGRADVDPALVDALERLRAVVASPVIILSGSRCARHNRRVGGAPASRHLIDKLGGGRRQSDAADVAVTKALSLRRIFRAAMAVPAFRNDGGVGVYLAQGFVHLDTRGRRARWGVAARGIVGPCPWRDDD